MMRMMVTTRVLSREMMILELTIKLLTVFEDETRRDDKVGDVEDMVEILELFFMLDVTLLGPEDDFPDEL